MNKVGKYFFIDDDSKTFVFGPRHYQELFIENSPVNKAYKAAMALGCYADYKPVRRETDVNPARNVATQNFTEDGVVAWLTDNNPEWLEKWKAAKEVKTADNKQFPFMVRKNYFLSENPAAREFCGMIEKPNKPYELRQSGKALKQAVEVRLAATKKAK